jgi:hypothetical protein
MPFEQTGTQHSPLEVFSFKEYEAIAKEQAVNLPV